MLQLYKENVWGKHLGENTQMISINVCNGRYMCSFFMSFPYVGIFMMGCYFYTYKSKVKVIVMPSHFEK